MTHAVSRNAVRFAKQNGYAAVTCGHTHFPEDTEVDGIRYINTGSWTEPRLLYIHVTDTDIARCEWNGSHGVPHEHDSTTGETASS